MMAGTAVAGQILERHGQTNLLMMQGHPITQHSIGAARCPKCFWEDVSCPHHVVQRFGQPHLMQPRRVLGPPPTSWQAPMQLASVIEKPVTNQVAGTTLTTEDERTTVLPAQEALRMLTDSNFQPGVRPLLMSEHSQQWIFKEEAGRKRRSPGAGDKWVHTAGKKGARALPLQVGGPLVVRRRYGRIVRQNTKQSIFRYNLYTLLDPDWKAVDGQTPPERKDAPTLWHVIRLSSRPVRPPDSLHST
jgi:hypothetical protein|eukprot:SAG25_NODE_238_length_11236_cov_37.046061_1_plen_246_part_00